MARAVGGWIRRRWLLLAVGAVAAVVVLGIAAVVFGPTDWGTPGERVASPDGTYEVVTYEWSAMIDPGWNLAIERADGEGREWFWRSTEDPAPKSIRFTGPTSIEVVDSWDRVYRVDFDPETLEPTDRYCLRTGYCSDGPWDQYTRSRPEGP